MITNVVPIVYNLGSGGHFLTAFLTAAKLNNPNIVQLSRFGNAHKSDLIIHIPKAPTDDISVYVAKVVTKLSNNLTTHSAYIQMHHDNYISTITPFFKKVILITYNQEDIEDLAAIFAAKFGLDSANIGFDEKLKREYRGTKELLIDYFDFYQTICEDNVFCVSWKELYHNDPILLIEKLSKYTEYNSNQFPLEKLMEWRKLTKFCVDKIARFTK